MESNEYGDPKPVVEGVKQAQGELSQKIDAIEKKVNGIYDLNTELLRAMAGTILMLENIGNLDNWFFSAPRKRIIQETDALRVKMIELCEKHKKILDY